MSKPYSSNPYSSKANLHHTETYRSEEDWWEANFGYGIGDPDRVGHYPGQKDDE